MKGQKPKRDAGTGKFVKRVETIVKESKPNQVTLAPPKDQAGRPGLPTKPAGSIYQNQQFPTAYLTAEDERDLMMQTRLAIGDSLGQQTFKDEDADWLLKKVQAAKDADFQSWFARNFDNSSVTHKKFAREIFPEFYKQRLQTFETNLDTLRKLARIKIRGLETAEDVALQYAADQGLLPLNDLKNLLNPGQADAADQRAAFERGVFNLNTYYSGSSVPNPTDQRTAYYGQAMVPATTFTGTVPRMTATRANRLINPAVVNAPN